ncbi:MAG: proline iminopeptidase-family hydrolase [Deltaproteobacteria bacterium]|nr:proline iminopeptidase-family hydrolase [Deltaproteobacteria bacterium]
MSTVPVQEGFVPFRTYKIWYRIVGDREEPGKLPLLCLHGGPGSTHDYLEPLEELAAGGRRIVFYDQLGAGNSDHPQDPDLWTVSLFVEELAMLRRALGLDRLHLFGQSWGGMLAMEYALTQPGGLAGLVLADAPASAPQWVTEINRLRAELPPELQETMRKHELAGRTDHPAYEEAMMAFYRRHLCRLDPWPDCLNRTFEKMVQEPEVYQTMWGPSEFYVTGTLKDWEITDRLGEIRVPTLVVGGRYDEATPAVTGTVQAGIPHARMVIFENSSHMPHLEETPLFLETLTDFLDWVEEN